MKEIFESFAKSLRRFDEILRDEKTVKSRDASIQRFEFTIELAWKCVQKFLRAEKVLCRSPRECLKEAFKFGLIPDDPRWLQAFEDRNLTAHTYNEKFADEVYSRLPEYLKIFQSLKDKLGQEVKQEV